MPSRKFITGRLCLLLAGYMLGTPALNAQPFQQTLERQVEKSVAAQQAQPKYYVPLIQLPEEEDAPAIFWVEIGLEYEDETGYPVPQFFYLYDKKAVFRVTPYEANYPPVYEPIIPAVFNEAYRRFAADPKSKRATTYQTRRLLTKYYRQVEAELSK